jgi:hypothetical protein
MHVYDCSIKINKSSSGCRWVWENQFGSHEALSCSPESGNPLTTYRHTYKYIEINRFFIKINWENWTKIFGIKFSTVCLNSRHWRVLISRFEYTWCISAFHSELQRSKNLKWIEIGKSHPHFLFNLEHFLRWRSIASEIKLKTCFHK